MAMSGATLKADLKSAILAQLQALFPCPSTLLQAEKDLYATNQSQIAEAFAYGDGPTTVSHISGNAVVAVTSVSGVMTGTSASGPGSGTIS